MKTFSHFALGLLLISTASIALADAIPLQTRIQLCNSLMIKRSDLKVIVDHPEACPGAQYGNSRCGDPECPLLKRANANQDALDRIEQALIEKGCTSQDSSNQVEAIITEGH